MTASLYIHIPFCKKKCDYCDFFSVGRAEREKLTDISDDYISALITEAESYVDFYGISEWRTIYVGGGTPSQLSSEQMVRLIGEMKKLVRTTENTEITVEMNPDDVREDFVEACERAGVNRISMGIQALDDRALQAVGRGSNVSIILNALSILKSHWHGRLSVDFIAGLPNHTWKSFKNQFAILETFPNIDHVSLYTLTVEENTLLYKRIEDGKIRFSAEKADRMWIVGRNVLEKRGFFQYEVSNFAKAGCESRHNSAYWKQECYIGVGAGASGTMYDWEKKSAVRWTNTRAIREYIAGAENRRETELLDEKTLEFEFLMLGFRQLSGVSSTNFEARFEKSLAERIGANRSDGVFSQWQKNRLAFARKKLDGDTVYSLNRRGILLLNRFLEELM